jgi:hypothetical protein
MAGQHKHQRELDDGGEDHWSDQCVKDAAEHAPKRKLQIKLGEAADLRASAGKVAVAHERDCKQNGEIERHQGQQGSLELADSGNEGDEIRKGSLRMSHSCEMGWRLANASTKLRR